MIGVIVVCLAAAAVIIGMQIAGGEQDSIETIPDDATIWVKCINPKCNATYEMSKKEFYQYLRDHEEDAPTGDGAIQLARCKECGKESLMRAVKCEKCGEVFIENSVPGKLPDTCPKCGYSKIAEMRKQAREQNNR